MAQNMKCDAAWCLSHSSSLQRGARWMIFTQSAAAPARCNTGLGTTHLASPPRWMTPRFISPCSLFCRYYIRALIWQYQRAACAFGLILFLPPPDRLSLPLAAGGSTAHRCLLPSAAHHHHQCFGITITTVTISPASLCLSRPKPYDVPPAGEDDFATCNRCLEPGTRCHTGLWRLRPYVWPIWTHWDDVSGLME